VGGHELIGGDSPNYRTARYTGNVPKNLTLRLDEHLLRAARKVAIDRNTSVNQVVRDFLVRLVWETDQRRAALGRLDEIFRANRIQVGRRPWKRQDLHER
jgi:hypothetical protein